MPGSAMMSSIWSRNGHNVVSSGAVTVTPVNVENIPIGATTCNAEIIKVEANMTMKRESSFSDVEEEPSDSDNEVSRIDFSGVTMRNKNENCKERIERPMSWEGELSDTEEIPPDDNNVGVKTSITVNNTNYIECGISNTDGLDEDPSVPLNFTTEVIVDQNSDNLLKNTKGGSYSPILQHKNAKTQVRPTASPDSAVHSYYSPTQSPVTSRHLPSSGFSSPATFTPSLSRNNSDASQYGGSQHSSCYSQSYSSISASPTQFSPTHSPVQGRHVYRNIPDLSSHFANNGGSTFSISKQISSSSDENSHVDATSNDQNDESTYDDRATNFAGDVAQQQNLNPSSGISRQQLINSPCPICGDKISGFHYGIFSCESCKGFFKRTVQNHKNYVCLRGSSCLVTITTRKKCPACRFEKCLNMGMKLEAIRIDRTRGGRSTYPFSYTLPANITQAQNSNDNYANVFKQETSDSSANRLVPRLLQEIMDVEHLWQYNENEKSNVKNNADPDFLSNLCNIADHRLYKIVKWCKSLPLFKNISIDDQISLLINAWCELLLFSCCYRSMSTPGEIRISLGKSISLVQANELGLAPCIERMLNFTEHLRRLRIDRYEYVAMKVIVLLSSDSSDLREPEKARASQEKALQALQQYTIAHYPDMPSKFGELLLRIPDLQRTCQLDQGRYNLVGKEMLSIKHKEGEGSSFNLLMELLRGDH